MPTSSPSVLSVWRLAINVAMRMLVFVHQKRELVEQCFWVIFKNNIWVVFCATGCRNNIFKHISSAAGTSQHAYRLSVFKRNCKLVERAHAPTANDYRISRAC